MKSEKLKYIDLFAGIGGFHFAMDKFGFECVFAAEIDKYAVETYYENFGINSYCDVTKLDPSEIPNHDLLLAGFPCQAFSKAGNQRGLADTRGTLFFDIEKILQFHKTKYILLENVRNLVSHDKGNTWKVIKNNLNLLGYRLTSEPLILSPNQLGTPHLRDRVFILGKYDPDNLETPLVIDQIDFKTKKTEIVTILEKNFSKDLKISEYEEMILNAWDEFYSGLKERVIGFPIWSFEFGKTYSLEDLPDWKKIFIEKNRKLYINNKKHIDRWQKKYNHLQHFVPTHRKFEWQAGNNISSLWEGIIQFRPSGIRVKRPDNFPALVAMVHVPIIGWQKRRLSVREAARLQNFPETFIPNNNKAQAYKQLGNSVNVKIIEILTQKLINTN
jgi:DNA (cytosine-5)-methyltransferase 1